jgi:hypothetical protein
VRFEVIYSAYVEDSKTCASSWVFFSPYFSWLTNVSHVRSPSIGTVVMLHFLVATLNMLQCSVRHVDCWLYYICCVSVTCDAQLTSSLLACAAWLIATHYYKCPPLNKLTFAIHIITCKATSLWPVWCIVITCKATSLWLVWCIVTNICLFLSFIYFISIIILFMLPHHGNGTLVQILVTCQFPINCLSTQLPILCYFSNLIHFFIFLIYLQFSLHVSDWLVHHQENQITCATSGPFPCNMTS